MVSREGISAPHLEVNNPDEKQTNSDDQGGRVVQYKALYRKWRPQTFSAVVGQDHVARTLINALKENRVGHAYLFSGPRGIGKTTIAKLLAKAVNCFEPEDGEPCNQCLSCTTISQGSNVDVLEIDGASNRGIEEIRDLQEKAQLSATTGQYKVYIIDEVHMLTEHAFNALLKTLEEPPGNVIFILATTEPYKLPLTITSRCQCFNFRRLSVGEIRGRLEEVVVDIGVRVAPGVLEEIALRAEGALRDALSLLDQAVTFAGADSSQGVTEDDLRLILGTVDRDLLYSVTAQITEGDLAGLLATVQSVADEGKNLVHFTEELAAHFRDLLLARVTVGSGGSTDEEEMPEWRERQARQAKTMDLHIIKNALVHLAELVGRVKSSSEPRLTLEMGLIELTGKASGRFDGQTQEELAPRIKAAADRPSPKDKGPDRPSPKDKGPDGPGSPELIHTISKSWQKIMQAVRSADASTHALLLEGRPGRTRDDGKGRQILTVYYSPGYEFHRDKIRSAKNRDVVEGVVKQLLGVEVVLSAEVEEANGNPRNCPEPEEQTAETSPSTEDNQSQESQMEAGDESGNGNDNRSGSSGNGSDNGSGNHIGNANSKTGDSAVKEALDLFGGELVEDS